MRTPPETGPARSRVGKKSKSSILEVPGACTPNWPKTEKPFTLKVSIRKPFVAEILKAALPWMLKISLPESSLIETLPPPIRTLRSPFGLREMMTVPEILKRSPIENSALVTVTENVPAAISSLPMVSAEEVVLTRTVIAPETLNPSRPTSASVPSACMA